MTNPETTSRRLTLTGSATVAIATALMLAGCGSKTGTDNGIDNAAMIDTANLATDNETATLDDSAVVEDETTVAQPVQVVEVPAPAADTPAAEAAPLIDAAEVAQVIAAGTGVTRVRQADGWAWMQNNQIIRTASTDGRRVSYFRNGSTTPYYVQQGGSGYAYSGGRVTRQFDSQGHGKAPDADHQRQGGQLATQAHNDHDHAQQAAHDASRGADHNANDHGANGHAPAPMPTQHPTPPAGSHPPSSQDHNGAGDHGTTSRDGSDHGHDGGSSGTTDNHQPRSGDQQHRGDSAADSSGNSQDRDRH